MNQEFYMNEAIKEADYGITNGHGGPFGCVIVKDGKILGRGHNQVVANNDPTCHGEVQAIRDACKNLETFDLSECELYTTAEPCPMCLGAIMWANISKVYAGCNVEDTNGIGFRDNHIYDYIRNNKNNEILTIKTLSRKECLELFERYNNISKKTMY